VHFTVEDLARLRMSAGLGPVAESVFALDMFGRQGIAHFQGWRKDVRSRLGARVGDAEQWASTLGSAARSSWLLERSAESAVGEDLAQQAEARAVFEFCQVAIMPYWERVRSHLTLVRDAWGRIEIANGVHGLLANLHPQVRWNPPVLEVPGEPDRDVHLDGRGFVLVLSLFLHGKNCVVIEAERGSGLPGLIVSVPIDEAVATELWGTSSSGDQALSALVGHTRAAALRALIEGCTTGELSERLGISLAGASKHAKVLRKAGLVTTSRHRNTALHTLTPLGFALLENRMAESAELCA
jgi:DNA-binding transcriptional ArsR family regulator